MSDVESIRAGTSDSFTRTLYENGLVKDLSAVTRVTLTIGAVTFDSASLGGVGAGQELDTSLGSGQLVVRLGEAGTLPDPGFYTDCVLTLYEPSATAGQPWGAALMIRIIGTESFTSVYADKGSMVARIAFQELVQLTDLGDSEEIDDLVLYEALQAADAEIDGYLGQRYDLPLDAVPANLERIACDIARYRLYRDGAPESVRERYSDARSWLKDVAMGRLQIGVNASQAAPTSAPLPSLATHQATNLVQSPSRIFSMHPKHGGGFD